MKQQYRAIVSSDWNECLAPSGPFDYIAFTFPELLPALDDIFQNYTGNRATLKDAMQQVSALLSRPVSQEQMDAYLDEAFRIYTGVTDLMEWCQSRKILFMLNTTGAVGYFQRVFFEVASASSGYFGLPGTAFSQRGIRPGAGVPSMGNHGQRTAYRKSCPKAGDPIQSHRCHGRQRRRRTPFQVGGGKWGLLNCQHAQTVLAALL